MRRLKATRGQQILIGVTGDRHAETAKTLEIYLDAAYGSIRIDTSEWEITFDVS